MINYGINFYPIGVFFIIASFSVIAYAIVKYRLLDIKIAITRTGIFACVYGLVLGLPFWVGSHTRSWLFSTSLAVVLASLGPFFYSVLRRKAEDILLAKQRHYQRMLLQAGKGMLREHNLRRLLKLIVYMVKKIVRVEFAALFLKDGGVYKLKAIRNHDVIPGEFAFSADSPLVNCLGQRRAAITYEEIKPLITQEPFYLGMHLAVPSFSQDGLLAFLVLGEKNDRSFYNEEDIETFEVLSHQATLAIENCLVVEEFKRSQEQLFQAEKLASIGGMASGVAHQIRNRLGVFSAEAGNIRMEVEDLLEGSSPLAESPQAQKSLNYVLEKTEKIESNVRSCSGIIKGILDFAGSQQRDLQFSHFPLQDLINLSLPAIMTKHSIDDFPLRLNLGRDSEIYGVKGQLVEVMFNCLDNAYEAIEEKAEGLSEPEKRSFVPDIKVALNQLSEASRIEISDNGIGVKQEDALRIFSPYFTTKSSTISGTGVGMFIVRRIIEENHKGRIWFKSEYKKGAQFVIELPQKRG
ncbi:MAG: sensor histidine kinase [Candidatus Omnitrophota bacterium]